MIIPGKKIENLLTQPPRDRIIPPPRYERPRTSKTFPEAPDRFLPCSSVLSRKSHPLRGRQQSLQIGFAGAEDLGQFLPFVCQYRVLVVVPDWVPEVSRLLEIEDVQDHPNS